MRCQSRPAARPTLPHPSTGAASRCRCPPPPEARAAGGLRTPDPRRELVAAEHAAGIAGERRQEGDLLRAGMDLGGVPPNPTADQGELDVRCGRDMGSRIRPEPAWIDQEMRATG